MESMGAGGTGGDASGSASGGAIRVDRAALRAYPPTVTFRDLIRKNKRRSALLMVFMILLGIALGGALGAPVGVATWRPSQQTLDEMDQVQATMHELAAQTDGLERHWGEIERLGTRREELREQARIPGFFDLLPSIALGAAAAFVAALIGTVWAWYGGSKAILALSGAHPIEKQDEPELFNVVEELSIAAGIPMPQVYRIESDALNAFATGRDPTHAAVAITRGLRERLTRDELAGVMAHEISHVRHYDIRFAMLMATMVGLIVFFSDAVRRGMLRSMRRPRISSGSKKGGGGGVLLIAMLVALVFSIVAPIIATLIHLAFSRQREYLADAGAVELTRYPEGLASALQKLSGSPVPLAQANRATEHLYIVKPLFDEDKDGRADPGSVQNANSVFSTHPPMAKRIARLMALVR